jgi:hypothetical protein
VLALSGVNQINTFPYIGVSSDLSTLNAQVPLEQYCLCITGMWDTPAAANPITFGFYGGFSAALPCANVVIMIEYTRFQNIVTNCDKTRILGAGLKAWSEQAPINTGGFSVGGWSTIEDIFEAVLMDNNNPVNPGALRAFQPNIKFACRSPGVTGSTVRYSPLQTSDQLESEYPLIPSRLYVATNQAFPQAPIYVDPSSSSDLAINDVITPGTFVPFIYWQFNTTDNSASVNNVYTVKLMSMVHSEGTPTGQSPFMSVRLAYDPATEHTKTMLENLETFPAATIGHTFKSFLAKAKSVSAKISGAVSRIHKIMTLADRFVQMV